MGLNLTTEQPGCARCDEHCGAGTDRLGTWLVSYSWERSAIVAGGHGKGAGVHQLNGPSKLALDPWHGDPDVPALLVVDQENNRIVRVVPEADEEPSPDVMYEMSGACGNVTAVTVTEESIHVATNTGTVERFKGKDRASMTMQRTLDAGNGGCFQGITADAKLNELLLVDCDLHGVLRVRPDPENPDRMYPKISMLAGGERGTGPDQLQCPWDVAEKDGVIYVCDLANERIMRWVRDAERGEVFTGGKGEGPRLDQLNSPCAIAIDPAGNVLVADFGNDRVLRVGAGRPPEVVLEIPGPTGVAVSDEYDLYVSCAPRNAVYKFLPE